MLDSINLYLVLGTFQSGRRTIVSDLIEGSGDFQSSNHIILINKNESDSSSSQKLQNLSNTHMVHWQFLNKHLHIPDLPISPSSSNNKIFLILSSKDDLIDQIEAFKNWLSKQPSFSLSRILGVIDAPLALKNPDALPWFEALIHFSDCIFLTHTEQVPSKWVNDFINFFEKLHSPAIFEKIKNNQISNPDSILNPQARRMSLLFDKLDSIDTLEIDENDLPDEPFDLKIKEDPYLERTPEGKRIIKLTPPAIEDL